MSPGNHERPPLGATAVPSTLGADSPGSPKTMAWTGALLRACSPSPGRQVVAGKGARSRQG